MHTIAELDLMAALGVGAEELARLRTEHLHEGDHWIRRGRKLRYTEEARQILAGFISAVPEEADQARRLLSSSQYEIVNLVVLRAHQQGIRNPRVLEALLPSADPDDRTKIKLVRVTNNLNYTRGMIILCRQVEGDIWEHWDEDKSAPARPPRSRGRI